MIDRGSEVAVKRQAELLDLSRSSVYYPPRPLSARDLRLMRRLDELHLQLPFYGSRKLAAQLRREGHEVGRRHVATLMRRMGIEALYRRPRSSIPARGAAIYPYLLSGLAIERPNTDQGSQFTGDECIKVLKDAGIAISMDGKGRWIDNVFIERLWRSVKYEEVYLHAYANGTEARVALTRYFRLYNAVRLHQCLDYRTPDEVYFDALVETIPVVARRATVTANAFIRSISGDTQVAGNLAIVAPGALYADDPAPARVTPPRLSRSAPCSAATRPSREAHALIEEIHQARELGEIKKYRAKLQSAEILVIDDLFLRRLPPSAG
jgi:putative transposase